MMFSDGGGWNGEVAARWPGVVVAGAVGAAGGGGARGRPWRGRVALRGGGAGRHPRETAPRGIRAQPSLSRGRGRYQIDVRRWEVRALETARRVMPSDQIRRRPRAATGRKRSAAATAGSRPAPMRRPDGSVYI